MGFSKYSFSANSKRMETLLGSLLVFSDEEEGLSSLWSSSSKWETDSEVRDERRSAESEGWMY